MSRPLVGTAGWATPRAHRARFPITGSGLARYAGALPAVEINTSFYRPHAAETYARWADSVPAHFRFAVKIPQAISHEARLVACTKALDRFLGEVAGLGEKLGPLLLQLPPSFAWRASLARFFEALRRRHEGSVVLEPRHRSWFDASANRVLDAHDLATVGADPACCPAAATPRGPAGTPRYWRLHGSPRIYFSRYDPAALAALADEVHAAPGERWCIFDNTAHGHAAGDALDLLHALDVRASAPRRARR